MKLKRSYSEMKSRISGDNDQSEKGVSFLITYNKAGALLTYAVTMGRNLLVRNM